MTIRDPRWRSPTRYALATSVVLAFLAVSLTFTASPAVAQNADLDAVRTGPLDVAGSLGTVSRDGAFTAGASIDDLSLEASAQEITVDFRVREGTRSSVNSEDRFVSKTKNAYHENETLHQASIEISPGTDTGTPQIVAFNASTTVTSSGVGEAKLTRELPSYLAGFGTRPDAQGAGEDGPLSFWPTPKDSWVRRTAADEIQVTGNLQLFINNATVEINGREESWRNWTGVRNEEAGPATETYERHLLLVRLERAQLTLSTEDGIDTYAQRFEATTEGVVSAERTTGILETSDGPHRFNEGPMELRGQGTLEITGAGNNTVPTAEALRLGIQDRGGLQILGGEPVPPSEEGLDIPSIPVYLAPLALLLVGALVVQRWPDIPLVDKLRSRRYARAMTHGRELANGGDLETAIDEFTRATELRPGKGSAWYHLALTLLEDGRPEDSLDAISEARNNEAVIDELDLLELEAQAGKAVDDWDRVESAVEKIADKSRAMAAGLVHDLDVPESVLGPELSAQLSDDDEGEFIGYV